MLMGAQVFASSDRLLLHYLTVAVGFTGKCDFSTLEYPEQDATSVSGFGVLRASLAIRKQIPIPWNGNTRAPSCFPCIMTYTGLVTEASASLAAGAKGYQISFSAPTVTLPKTDTTGFEVCRDAGSGC